MGDQPPQTYPQKQRLPDEYAASMHDRASPNLRTAAYHWDALSGYLGPGDRVTVTYEPHRCHGKSGTVGKVRSYNTVEVILDEEVDGKREGIIRREHITRLGYGRVQGYNVSDKGIAMTAARDHFLREARAEVRRIEAIMMNDAGHIVRHDVDGNEIVIGDLVVMMSEMNIDHPLINWVCKVVTMQQVGPIELEPLMPPQVLRRPSRLDLVQRRHRMDHFQIDPDRVRLFENVPAE